MPEPPADLPPLPPRRPRRWYIRLGWLALGCSGLFVLAILEENWRGARAWRLAVAELRAAGEPTELAQILPPPAADAENFAAIPLFQPLFDFVPIPPGREGFTSARLRDPEAKERIDALNLPIVKDAGYFLRSQFIDLAAWQRALEMKDGQGAPSATVLEALRKFDPELEALREAAKRPRARFPIRYQDQFPLLPHVDFFRNFPRIVALRSIAELEEGEVEAAHADLLLGLDLEEALREDPSLISGLVRVIALEAALPPLWEGLARSQWNEAQLASLDAALERCDFLASFQTAIRAERLIFTSPAMDVLKSEPDLIATASAPEPGIWFGKAVWWLAPFGWFDSSKAALSRRYRELTLAADPRAHRFYPPRIRAVEQANELTDRPHPFDTGRILIVLALSNTPACGERFAYAQAYVDLARTAIALERYRLAHGTLPESLSALPGVPSDVIGGAPLRYRLKPDGSFALYSIGWNERDDGGVAASRGTGKILEALKEGDWIWPPYPGPAAVK